jgi:hypothetical protein
MGSVEYVITRENEGKPKRLVLISISIVFILIFLLTFLVKNSGTAMTFRFMELILLILTSIILLRFYDFRIESAQIDGDQKKRFKIKFKLWVGLSVATGVTFLLTGLDSLPVDIILLEIIIFLLLFIELICLTLFSIVALKYYDLPLVFFLIVLVGLYVKRLHWVLAAQEMSIGTIFLSIVSLYNSGRFLITFRNNQFLKWFGFVAGIIITLFMTGMLVMNMHWPGKAFCISSGCLMFIIYVLAIVFTLPNSNFISWTGVERKVFYRAVLIPMVFIFALITLIIVFPDTYDAIMGRMGRTLPGGSLPYEVNTIKLFGLEGILP